MRCSRFAYPLGWLALSGALLMLEPSVGKPGTAAESETQASPSSSTDEPGGSRDYDGHWYDAERGYPAHDPYWNESYEEYGSYPYGDVYDYEDAYWQDSYVSDDAGTHEPTEDPADTTDADPDDHYGYFDDATEDCEDDVSRQPDAQELTQADDAPDRSVSEGTDTVYGDSNYRQYNYGDDYYGYYGEEYGKDSGDYDPTADANRKDDWKYHYEYEEEYGFEYGYGYEAEYYSDADAQDAAEDEVTDHRIDDGSGYKSDYCDYDDEYYEYECDTDFHTEADVEDVADNEANQSSADNEANEAPADHSADADADYRYYDYDGYYGYEYEYGYEYDTDFRTEADVEDAADNEANEAPADHGAGDDADYHYDDCCGYEYGCEYGYDTDFRTEADVEDAADNEANEAAADHGANDDADYRYYEYDGYYGYEYDTDFRTEADVEDAADNEANEAAADHGADDDADYRYDYDYHGCYGYEYGYEYKYDTDSRTETDAQDVTADDVTDHTDDYRTEYDCYDYDYDYCEFDYEYDHEDVAQPDASEQMVEASNDPQAATGPSQYMDDLDPFTWPPRDLLQSADKDLLRALNARFEEPSGVRDALLNEYIEGLGMDAVEFVARFEEAFGNHMLMLHDDLPGVAALLATYRMIEQGEFGMDEAVDALQRHFNHLSPEWIEDVSLIITEQPDHSAASAGASDEDDGHVLRAVIAASSHSVAGVSQGVSSVLKDLAVISVRLTGIGGADWTPSGTAALPNWIAR